MFFNIKLLKSGIFVWNLKMEEFTKWQFSICKFSIRNIKLFAIWNKFVSINVQLLILNDIILIVTLKAYDFRFKKEELIKWVFNIVTLMRFKFPNVSVFNNESILLILLFKIEKSINLIST